MVLVMVMLILVMPLLILYDLTCFYVCNNAFCSAIDECDDNALAENSFDPTVDDDLEHVTNIAVTYLSETGIAHISDTDDGDLLKVTLDALQFDNEYAGIVVIGPAMG